jgi:hypothetical protein
MNPKKAPLAIAVRNPHVDAVAAARCWRTSPT